MPLKFEGGNWQAVIAEEFTFANLRLVSQGICNYTRKLQTYADNFPPQLVVGYDSRFMGRHFADIVSEVIANNGLDVFQSDRPAPTPAISWMIFSQVASGALIITGGDESAEYNGVKFVTSRMALADEDAVQQIEREVENLVEIGPFQNFAISPGEVSRINPKPAYFQQLQRYVDLDVIAATTMDVTIDYLYGAASGYLGELFAPSNHVLREVRCEPSPDFSGLVPALLSENLHPLQEIVIVPRSRLALGIAIDGDGCRIQAVDACGTILSHDSLQALLLDYLLTTKGMDGGIIKPARFQHPLTEQVARHHDIPVMELGTSDFRQLTLEMVRSNTILATDCQGGYAFSGHIMERDGILTSLLLLEMVAIHRQNLDILVEKLKAKVGTG